VPHELVLTVLLEIILFVTPGTMNMYRHINRIKIFFINNIIIIRSEWIYWEVLSLVVGTIGVTELTVHMISTQIIMVTYMIPLGVSEAISIRLGNIIPQSASRAKQLYFWYLVSGTATMTVVSLSVYIFRLPIYHLFTKEDDIIEGCEEIWSKVCFYIFTIGIWSIMDGITTSLGRQWIVGILVVVLLWSISLPLLYYLVIIKNGGLNVAWQCIWPPNLLLIIILAIYISRLDWDAVSEEARMNDSDDDSDDEGSESIPMTKKNDKNVVYGSISQETASLSI
jgi:multidrug resistance protein, MATE family